METTYEEDAQKILREISEAKKLLVAAKNKYRPSVMDQRYYTSEQLQKTFHISKRCLQNYRDQGVLPFTMIGDKLLYRESDIEEILQANYKKALDY